LLSHAYLVQVAASGAAVAALVGLAAWARIARPTSPLTESAARVQLAAEFPGRAIEQVWVAVDGAGALAKSGASALVLCQLGDGYVARQIPWAQALSAAFKSGRITLDLGDVAAPKATISLAAWPPRDLAA
jgi:HAMP domain-containing protein